MITTVTSTTVTINAIGMASLTLIFILTLLVLLIQKEIIGGLGSMKARRLSRALNIAVIPISVAFVVSLLLELLQLVR